MKNSAYDCKLTKKIFRQIHLTFRKFKSQKGILKRSGMKEVEILYL